MENVEKVAQVYDELCNITYVNLYTLSKEKGRIILAPFEYDNKEHLFIAYIAKALGGISEKDVFLQTKRKYLRMINANIKKEYHFQLAKNTMPEDAINPQEVLDFMRPYASQIAHEDNFDFGKIYEAFYETRKEQENDI